MTEETKEKVSEEAKGNDPLQVEFSKEKPDSSTSALTPEQFSALSEQLAPIIEDAVERRIKSTTDKRFSRLEKSESVAKEVLATLKAQGVAIPKELERDYELREYVDQRIEAATAGAGKSMSGTGVDSEGDFNVVEELKKLELDTNDVEVIAMVKDKKFRNPDHFRAEALALALRKAKTPPSDDTTNSPATGGSGKAKLSDEKKEELGKQIVELQREPTTNAAKIKILMAQLKGES
jgi:hypothetical protein